MANDDVWQGKETDASVSAAKSGVGQTPLVKSFFRRVPIESALGTEGVAERGGSPAGDRGGNQESVGVDESTAGFTRLFQVLSDAGKTGPQADAIQDARAEPLRDSRSVSIEEGNGLEMRHDGGPEVSEENVSSSATTGQDKGEFTRLFQSLGTESSARTAEEPVRRDANSAGFTQLLRTLSEEDAPRYQPAARPVQAPAISGQGEFTRVISGSMLRKAQGSMAIGQLAESQQDRHPQLTPEQAAGADQTHGRQAGGANTEQADKASGAPVAVSQMLQAGIPLQGTVPSRDASMGAMDFYAPSGHLPGTDPGRLPQVTVAAVKSRAMDADRWQRYLPLLMVANLFLMLLVLAVLLLSYRH